MWKTKYTINDKNKIIELRKSDPTLTRTDIVRITGCNIAFVKRVLKGMCLPKGQGQKNAYRAKLAKNPNAMTHMRQALTPEVVVRRSEAVREAYRDNLSELSKNARVRMEQWFIKNPKISKYTWQDLETITKNIGFTLVSDPIDKMKGWGFKQVVLRCFCNNMFDSKVYDLLLGKVNSCGCVKSKAQADINILLQNWGFETKYNDWVTLKDYELDILIPSHKLAIEYCGLWAHGVNNSKGRGEHRQFKKSELCKDLGIRLITIFSDEWILRRKQVVGYLRSVLHVDEFKIGARKCEIQDGGDDIQSFLDKWHIQGKNCNSTSSLGLFNDSGIIAAMTFSASNSVRGKSESGVFELTRWAVKPGFLITGGFSRLLNYFIGKYRPYKIISYSDNRWSAGGVYRRNGFELEHSVAPNYYYFKHNTDYPRFPKNHFKKDKIGKIIGEKLEITEWEAMRELGFDRIYDCGKDKWVLNLT